MTQLTQIEKLKSENIKISKFIKSWQLKNDILNFDCLESFNKKFKSDFNKFLNENDFSEENLKLFLIK